MRITKYEHACLDVTESDTRVIIDSGKFSNSLRDYSNIAAVVITHVHGDHFDPDKLQKIIENNSEVRILTTSQVISEFADNTELAITNQPVQIGDITLEFFGKDHELYKEVENIGVMVNNRLFYPGDSYEKPNKKIEVLAAPASAPWLRVPDAQAYIKDCAAKITFPIHNALLSEIGESIHYRLLNEACNEIGSKWEVLRPSESLTI